MVYLLKVNNLIVFMCYVIKKILVSKYGFYREIYVLYLHKLYDLIRDKLTM